MQISEELPWLYHATVEQQEDSYVLEAPGQEVQNGDLSLEEVYKVALVATPSDKTESPRDSSGREQPADSEPSPPVDEGDIRRVETEGVGDQGDGLGKIGGGYVVIVPDTEPGDTVTVEMETVRENFDIAEVIQAHREDNWKKV
ncbi:deoxyribonuclease [Halobellus salinus]|uniref:Deoxyribonuclease n=1 Tax=Halobellus salinus TaxID=931585 RepID=A0A830EJ45_9EURY|nr:TRAM domain-containing protein [Halobellus salinus]GGJ15352.1 deoxyribonuclease [Halobellus salinus]